MEKLKTVLWCSLMLFVILVSSAMDGIMEMIF